MSSFQLQADMYNSITQGEVEAKKLEERVKKLEERPHGKWIAHEGYNVCPFCNNKTAFGYPFCPYCSADMREAGE